MGKIVVLLLLTVLITGCSSTKRRLAKSIDTQINTVENKYQFTGFLVIDATTQDTLYSCNSTKYFTPASNTKIFTLFTALRLLPDRIPTLRYAISKDTLFIQGTGDPSTLHPYLKDSTALHFLKDYTNIALYSNNFRDEKFGPGWAWDDYQYYYSPERSGFPLYGNVLTIENNDTLSIQPDYFKDSILPISYALNRDQKKNHFYFDISKKDTLEIPFIVESSLTRILLERSLQRKIHSTDNMPVENMKVLYGMPADTVYKRMMQVSDNFLAEQLLILASSTLSDTLSSEKARQFVLENHLSEVRQPPRWVDGSGLSRYNLFTPESIVHVLYKLYLEIPKERLLQFFPTGGESGTLEDWYPGNPIPYLYAKTGSLSNNHCLSGYLMTKSGKTLIFSFMNNHFMEHPNEIKKRMQTVFEKLRDNY